MTARLLLVIALVGCDREATKTAPAPTPQPAPVPLTDAAPQAAPAPIARGADIRVVGTTKSGEILEIGRPRLRVSPDAGIGIGASATRVFAMDREAIAVWSLADGVPLGRFQLEADSGLPALIVSPDGTYVVSRGTLISVANTGAMALASTLGGTAHHFTSDAAQIAMTGHTPKIIDVATRRVLQTAPALPTYSGTLDLDRGHWLRGDGVYAWDHAKNGWTQVLAAKAPWKFGRLAGSAQVAIVSDDASISRIDLAARMISLVLPKGSGRLAVSPNGERIAINRDVALRIFDTRSGKEVASTPVTLGEYTPAAFANDNVVVFRDRQDVRVFDLRTGLRAFPLPSRFVGWIDGATAALSRGTTLDRLDIKTRATTALDVAPAAPATLDCAEILDYEPCRVRLGKRRVSGMLRSIEVFDGEEKIARIEVGSAPRWANEIKQEYFAYALSPSGSHLAVVWRRPDVFGPNEGRNDSEPHCESESRSDCIQEYFVEVWSLGKTAKRVWRSRTARETASRMWPYSKQASGALAFTHDGKHVLVGFDDGDVMIRSVTDEKYSRVESLHDAMVTRIVVAPGDTSVFTEYGSGEQRIWPLSR